MITLYPFQSVAADQIAERSAAYINDPIVVSQRGSGRPIPFIQLLDSITASGKTVVMADAVSTISKLLPVKPLVLWLSKATVVVEQTYANLDVGGLYHSLLDDFQVRLLADYDDSEVSESPSSFLYFGTVGLINQKDKEKGDRRIFRSSIDDAARSTWDSLKMRAAPSNLRRPLLVVYDEAHNLSDQQTDILLELTPDAFLLATATHRLPKRVNDEIVEVLRNIGDKSDDDLITRIDAKAVASTALIKTQIDLVGRQAQTRQVVAEMLDDLRHAEQDSQAVGMVGLPKAVYVCRTNIVEGSEDSDDPKQPFLQRQAPPILIWRELVENLAVPPSEVCVYANLKVHRNFPLPPEFVLFAGGDKDYERFISGEYRHIIFNQALQEGWDDPLVYYAYIDKSMGSRVQAEQIVGRLLRQPGRQHYAAERLNTAQIFIRVENAGVFHEVVELVQTKIRSDNVPIKIATTSPSAKRREEVLPSNDYFVPRVAIVDDDAHEAIARCIDKMTDYRNDAAGNTIGTGRRTRVQRLVGERGDEAFVWEDYAESAMVLVRWLFTREVRRVHPGALGLALTSDPNGSPTKFDGRIGLGSNAAEHITHVARAVGEAFVDNVYLKLVKSNPYQVGPGLIDRKAAIPFPHAVHGAYDGLNGIELEMAHALERTGLAWTRNPSRTGYKIPLVEPGRTGDFYPDFLAWQPNHIFAIETKGAYLHSDALRKLVHIKPGPDQTPSVQVRFVMEGLVEASGLKADASGYTVLSLRAGGKRNYVHFPSMDDVLVKILTPTA